MKRIEKGLPVTFETTLEEIQKRDERDVNRRTHRL